MIGVAAGFPTTVNPILQFGAVPVFVDVDIPTYNIDPQLIEQAITPKTKAIMLAHTLGNPFNLAVVQALCEKYNLWLVEDCCDALGSTYDGRMVGTFGDIGTLQLLPCASHHHGRRRRGFHAPQAAGRDCGILPRLGSRLLLPAGAGQYLFQAFQLETGRASTRLRPQVHVFASRL